MAVRCGTVGLHRTVPNRKIQMKMAVEKKKLKEHDVIYLYTYIHTYIHTYIYTTSKNFTYIHAKGV